ncbi:non-canonical purine NTP pyrophosphatase [Paenibacillus xylanexedens]|uniref:non-canonical purine NTP pyrophosphatase n=1 Tax=Paenibacillus xylanexedens TaxID=528191 RepID=UPI0011A6E33B|nr:non-canonical purine NTP pyrophosphatase [Paenibacillus xylanexedens]
MEIIFATWNPRKTQWIKEGLLKLPIPIRALFAGEVDEVDENGNTFEENALLKANAVQIALNRIIVAEDSGLCVHVLDGDPGVRTARWAPGTDDDRSLKLLEELKHVTNPLLRAARFKSVIAIRFPDGSSSFTYGELEGRIAFSQRGKLASGYSRIFELPNGLTIAENGVEVNDHHSQALAMATERIKEWIIAHEARGDSLD